MPETHFDTIEFADKWVHFVMYGGMCGVIWLEYFINHSQTATSRYNIFGRKYYPFSVSRLFLFAWLLPVIMGGLLELLQAYCTSTRSGDWIDFLANSIGVTLAAAIMIPLAVVLRKRNAM